MSLTINEIKNRAIKFASAWKNDSSERAEAQTFWNEFFEVFGLSRRRLASFEKPAIKSSCGRGRIDLFWKGVLIAEHKSKGQDLDKAYSQALDYFYGLKEQELPKYVIVSDFAQFRVYDLEEDKSFEFRLEELYKNISYLDFLTGYTKREFKDEDPVNEEAALLIGKLHDSLENNGYQGHQLEVFLVRLLFILFAEDAGIIQPKGHFQWLLENKTSSDGRDTGAFIQQVFEILDTPEDKRQNNLDEDLLQLPYVNGSLFSETFRIPSFDTSMRDCLIQCCSVDWSYISPAIFGSMFQAAMNPKERRNLGAHYTSEKNVMKVVKDLFLDELWEEFNKCKNNFNKLLKFHDKMSNLKFLDPACGCGNFLIITYRELRLLEIDIIRAKRKFYQDETLDLETSAFSRVNVDQLFGIEIEEFPSRISEVALWLTDHQMNIRLSQAFGEPYIRLPLKVQPNIHNKNALRIDWNEVIKKEEVSFILGNPPFIGKQLRHKEQNEDMDFVFKPLLNKGYGVLDYVSAWYIKAADFIKGTNTQIAFVSTNSITQGEQVGVLWGYLLSKGVKINFAHRTFKWTNEAKGKAAVFCVIIGFAFQESSKKKLYEYETVSSEPHLIEAPNINPYLINCDDLIIQSISKPICDVPYMLAGGKVVDDGNFLFTDEEKNEFIDLEKESISYFKELVSAEELINGIARWCLWLNDVNLAELKNLKNILLRIEAVKQFRLKSKKEATRKLASRAYSFVLQRFNIQSLTQLLFL